MLNFVNNIFIKKAIFNRKNTLLVYKTKRG